MKPKLKPGYVPKEIDMDAKENMKPEEFEKLYGEVGLKFDSYYKYTFNFKGIADDGTEIFASYGGCYDDIYRFEVTADAINKVGDVLHWDRLVATKDDKEIFDITGD